MATERLAVAGQPVPMPASLVRPNRGKHFVAIAGNIGVGKSSLTGALGRRLGWEPFFEAVSENPYLADFYADMGRYAFHSQVFFLSRRLLHHRRLLDHPTSAVQDRSVYEDAQVFARALFEQGHMNGRDYQTYCDLYDAVNRFLPPPDLIVYLRAEVPTLLRRIALRGRTFERNISATYLAELNALYEAWISSFTLCPVLTIQADDIDFVHHPYDLDTIVDRITSALPSDSDAGRQEEVQR